MAVMIALPGGVHLLTIRYRLRETGMYGPAPFHDLWKPLPPRLHHVVEEQVVADLARAAVAPAEVTNAEYARFIAATGYRPDDATRFLAHWKDGAPSAQDEGAPVTCVSLDDARAYAAWASLRLPTEHEWQIAAADPRFVRLAPHVWNWTESEQSDGRARSVILKGGPDAMAGASEWYADAGSDDPAVSFKLLRASPGIERSARIGFRCATSRRVT